MKLPFNLCLWLIVMCRMVHSLHYKFDSKISRQLSATRSLHWRAARNKCKNRRGTAISDAHNDAETLSFGSKLIIDIKLPSKDRDMVDNFLRDTEYIVENTWERTKLKKVSPSTYLLKFISIPIPGLDIVTPEIEVTFENIGGVVYMKSGRWSLLNGKGTILKDSNFVTSFDISLTGQLTMAREDDYDSYDFDEVSSVARKRLVGGALVKTEGFVVYQVKGRKPSVFRRAPAMLLDGTINFVQKCVSDFVNKRFSTKLTKAFREYSRQAQLSDEL